MTDSVWNAPAEIPDDSEDLVIDINELEPGSLVNIIMDDGVWSGGITITGIDKYYVHIMTAGGNRSKLDKNKFKRWIAQKHVLFIYHAPSMPSEEVADMMVPDTFPEDWQLYYRDSALEHGPDPTNGLNKEDIVTQCAWCQRFQLPGSDEWVNYNPMPGAPVSHGICPDDMVKMMPQTKIAWNPFKNKELEDLEREWWNFLYDTEVRKGREPDEAEQRADNSIEEIRKNIKSDQLLIDHYRSVLQQFGVIAKKSQGLPATYTPNDPLDMDNARALVDDLDSQWWTESPEIQRQAIANAFRAALVSPRQNLKWNAIVYQDLMHLGSEVTDPQIFEQTIRDRKAKWDQFGQRTIDLINENADDPEWIDYGPSTIEKYMPGIWQNVRNAGIIGPYVEDLRQAAIEDVARGGTGQYFRQELLNLQIPGIGPKIAAFVWLLLCPKTSHLATIDIHMMRALGKDAQSPADLNQYLQYEKELEDKKNEMGYEDVPLGAYQWALWDWQRTPGYHQDHTPLRPLNPVDWRNIDWSPQQRVRAKPQPEIPPEQMSLTTSWKLYD